MKLRLFAATVAATAAVGAVAGILWSRRAGDESASAKGEVSQHELIAKGDIGVGDPIPLSRTEPILSIRGLISNTNDGARTRMDMDALESLPLVRLRVYEPFEDKGMTFEGVLVSDLIKIVGANASAHQLHIEALDDYSVDLSLAEISRSSVVLATKADGKPMSIADGGPTRIIFPSDSPMGRNIDLWIWNVESIVVR